MFDERTSRGEAAAQDTPSAEKRPNAKPLADALLKTLASFDLEHEHELERVRRGSSPQAVKNRVLYSLQERHRIRREPYIQQLALLRSCAGLCL